MDEEIANKKYIMISHSDFLEIFSGRSVDSYFRSLEAYLRKNNRAYNIDGQTCTVYVYDKSDAMSLGLHFGLRKLKYFDGVKLTPIALKAKKTRDSFKVEIFDSAGNKTTFKKLKEQSFEKAKSHCLEKKEIIKRKILTKKELENAIEGGELSPINIENKTFIDRQELAGFIKKL